jgi:hypothetical protein
VDRICPSPLNLGNAPPQQWVFTLHLLGTYHFRLGTSSPPTTPKIIIIIIIKIKIIKRKERSSSFEESRIEKVF